MLPPDVLGRPHAFREHAKSRCHHGSELQTVSGPTAGVTKGPDCPPLPPRDWRSCNRRTARRTLRLHPRDDSGGPSRGVVRCSPWPRVWRPSASFAQLLMIN